MLVGPFSCWLVDLTLLGWLAKERWRSKKSKDVSKAIDHIPRHWICLRSEQVGLCINISNQEAKQLLFWWLIGCGPFWCFCVCVEFDGRKKIWTEKDSRWWRWCRLESIIGCTLDSTWDFIHWVVSSGLWVGYTCMYSRLNLIGLGDCPSSPLHDTVSFLEAQNTPGIGYIVRLKLESNTITFWWFSMWNNGLFYLSFYSENKM